MYSNFIKFLTPLTGLSPILFSLWLVRIILNWDNLTVFIDLKNFDSVSKGFLNILNNHGLLFIFLLILWFCKYLLNQSIKDLTRFKIEVKSIKPADINFVTILFSYILPFSKIYFSEIKDYAFIMVYLILYSIYAFITKDSYHYNLIFKLFGYRNYEVQTRDEVTYLLLSKTEIISPSYVTSCVKLADSMLINVSQNKI